MGRTAGGPFEECNGRNKDGPGAGKRMLLNASLHPGVPAGVYFLRPLFFLRRYAVSSAIYINPSLI
jgi:hypothetical protein